MYAPTCFLATLALYVALAYWTGNRLYRAGCHDLFALAGAMLWPVALPAYLVARLVRRSRRP